VGGRRARAAETWQEQGVSPPTPSPPAASPPLARPLIEVRGLTKSYGDHPVLTGVDLVVERGETCIVVGGSGSGKSTLARLLIGLERPDSGEILIDGVDLAKLRGRDLDTLRQKFAMVFQGRALLDSMSVFDNVAFGLREGVCLDPHGRPNEATIDERVHHMLQELDVDDAADRLPGALSGGMAKRVGIARALVGEPEILIYDEPTSGLDPVSSRIVDGLIEQMRVAHGVTSVVITHDMVTAYDVADSLVLLANGKAVVQGAPEVLFHTHASAIEPFAKASGIDLTRLGPREKRPSAAELRARWAAKRGTPLPPRS
jgi:phospholipid/cholesterol/gamma-HCH transport system ATP-binding protein